MGTRSRKHTSKNLRARFVDLVNLLIFCLIEREPAQKEARGRQMCSASTITGGLMEKEKMPEMCIHEE